MKVFRLRAWRCWLVAGTVFMGLSAQAATFTVGGSVSGLTNNGLVLHLDSNPPAPPSCIPDNGIFTLMSTDTNDCFTPQNLAKCCSNSIKFTATDGISTVTCTCGIIIPPKWQLKDGAAGILKDLTQDLPVAANATAFTFATAIDDGSTYSVTVKTQPSNQSCSVSNGDGTVSGANVTNVVVTCATITYTVTGSVSGTGGTIGPASQTANSGSQATLTVIPDPGFAIAGATGCGGNLSGNTYTTAPLTASCAVVATFSAVTYTVTASVSGGGGTIGPASQTGNFGSQATFTVTPDPGFFVAAISGCGGSLSNGIYTTAPLTASCAVVAIFTAVPAVATPALSMWVLLLLSVCVAVSVAMMRRIARK